MIPNASLPHIVWVNIVQPALLGTARVDNVLPSWKRYNRVAMSGHLSRFKRLRWKLTWSYTWVAAITFLIIATVLLPWAIFKTAAMPQPSNSKAIPEAAEPEKNDLMESLMCVS